MKIIATPSCVIQFRFPRSKRKRIRKRWANRVQNFRPDPNFYVSGDTVICHPKFARLLDHFALEEMKFATKEKAFLPGRAGV